MINLMQPRHSDGSLHLSSPLLATCLSLLALCCLCRSLKHKTKNNTQANTPTGRQHPTVEIPPDTAQTPGKTPPASAVRFAEHDNTYVEVEEKPEDYEVLFAKQKKMQKKFPQSDLSVPGIHSSKVG